MNDDDLHRLRELQREIRKEAYSPERRNDLLWVLVEKLGEEVLALRAELEKVRKGPRANHRQGDGRAAPENGLY